MVQLADDIEAVLVARRWARPSVRLPTAGRFAHNIDASKPGPLLVDAEPSTRTPWRIKLSRTNAFR